MVIKHVGAIFSLITLVKPRQFAERWNIHWTAVYLSKLIPEFLTFGLVGIWITQFRGFPAGWRCLVAPVAFVCLRRAAPTTYMLNTKKESSDCQMSFCRLHSSSWEPPRYISMALDLWTTDFKNLRDWKFGKKWQYWIVSVIFNQDPVSFLLHLCHDTKRQEWTIWIWKRSRVVTLRGVYRLNWGDDT